MRYAVKNRGLRIRPDSGGRKPGLRRGHREAEETGARRQRPYGGARSWLRENSTRIQRRRSCGAPDRMLSYRCGRRGREGRFRNDPTIPEAALRDETAEPGSLRSGRADREGTEDGADQNAAPALIE